VKRAPDQVEAWTVDSYILISINEDQDRDCAPRLGLKSDYIIYKIQQIQFLY